MARNSDGERLERLEAIKAILGIGEPTTIEALAEQLGASARTVRRDLSLLRERGVPIESERGRGGGVRLDRTWGVGRVNFSYAEAVDLLVSLSVAEQMKSPLLMAQLEGVRRKLMASFSPDMRGRVRRLKARILVGPTVSSGLLEGHAGVRPRVAERLHQGFFEQRSLAITYRARDGAITRRVVQPHYLMLSYPIWYVVGWDELRGGVRTFRCDRVSAARLESSTFQVLPRSRFAEALVDLDLR